MKQKLANGSKPNMRKRTTSRYGGEKGWKREKGQEIEGREGERYRVIAKKIRIALSKQKRSGNGKIVSNNDPHLFLALSSFWYF